MSPSFLLAINYQFNEVSYWAAGAELPLLAQGGKLLIFTNASKGIHPHLVQDKII